MKETEFHALRRAGKITTQIYFAAPSDGGPIKIGCSMWPENRVAGISSGSPLQVNLLASVPGTKADEKLLHARFAADRLHGEWFRPSADLLSLIDAAKATGTLPT